ncbi:MAG: transcription-repair coupling factor [Elusimicrobia bacterium]|nr:transcription-repair coupling factor [Elusimicrobiota bacterium]
MLNSLELSGALAYSVIKKQHLYNNILILMKNDEDADDVSQDILTISRILRQPPLKVAVFPENNIYLEMKTLSQIIPNEKICLCTTANILDKKIFSPESFKEAIIKIKKGDTINQDFLVSKLSENGYERVDIVTDIGEFSIRGEIIDIWVVTFNLPVRFVFNITEIETIKYFDPNNQRSVSEVNETEIIPAKEKEEVTILEYLKHDMDTANKRIDNGVHTMHTFTDSDVVSYLPISEFNGNLELFSEKFYNWQKEDFEVFIVANNEGEKNHLSETLGTDFKNFIFIGQLSSGFIIDDDKIVFVTTNEIFSRYKSRIRTSKFFKKIGTPLETLSDIKTGDFVVHEKYGIGIYDGLKKITSGEITAEYISVLYANNDKLFVPINDFQKLQKYFGLSKKPPKINSLDNTAWERTRVIADENARKLAQQLLQIYVERFNVNRQPFLKDSQYEKEFENEFIYEETPDQIKAINDVKNDMTGQFPMERCIFGDTGFGKTEVAMRAALKAVLSGKQVCLMAPTTILVQQHEQTFLERFADWPVKLKTLSRFKTKKEQKEIIEELKNGKVDIIIGTHRLLSKDISFSDLGLLIIDEEHRFGVADKEKIKSLKKNVDCLYLTATPIPRTLSMALSGIKNMSSIETPPAGRQSVETNLLEYDEQIIKNAVMHEFSRGGQIFYIHNKIGTIEKCLYNLKKTFPFVKFDFLHSKMTPKEIENKMLRFLKKDFDCLISTTIIEAGLDIPNVNTIIIEEAENFGLSQLYQLRGRVGRSKTKAYCYLFYKTEELTEIAEKRLVAIKEFANLGSGFRLALKDLQIRGAGEILGKKQHGCVDSIGFDMYLKLLEKHSNEIKGIKTEEEIIPKIDISVDAIIPSDYINNEALRIGFYKNILTADSLKNLNEIKIEMKDRFGRVPDEVENLMAIGEIRLMAKKLAILQITSSPSSVMIKFSKNTTIEPSKILSILKNKKFRFIKNDLVEIFFEESLSHKKNIVFIKNLLQSFK